MTNAAAKKEFSSDPEEHQHNQNQKTIPGTSIGLTQEKKDNFYQQKAVYDDNMMYTVAEKFISSDTNIFGFDNTTKLQAAAAALFHLITRLHLDNAEIIPTSIKTTGTMPG